MFISIDEDKLKSSIYPAEFDVISGFIKDWKDNITSYLTKIGKYNTRNEILLKHMRLTVYDKYNDSDFGRTKKLLKLFYEEKVKELDIDLNLVYKILNDS
jgi:hypothetical protein